MIGQCSFLIAETTAVFIVLCFHLLILSPPSQTLLFTTNYGGLFIRLLCLNFRCLDSAHFCTDKRSLIEIFLTLMLCDLYTST